MSRHTKQVLAVLTCCAILAACGSSKKSADPFTGPTDSSTSTTTGATPTPSGTLVFASFSASASPDDGKTLSLYITDAATGKYRDASTLLPQGEIFKDSPTSTPVSGGFVTPAVDLSSTQDGKGINPKSDDFTFTCLYLNVHAWTMTSIGPCTFASEGSRPDTVWTHLRVPVGDNGTRDILKEVDVTAKQVGDTVEPPKGYFVANTSAVGFILESQSLGQFELWDARANKVIRKLKLRDPANVVIGGHYTIDDQAETIIDLNTGSATPISDLDNDYAQVSPDGKWIAGPKVDSYQPLGNTTGTLEWYSTSTYKLENKVTVAVPNKETEELKFAGWSLDSKTLYFTISGSAVIQSVSIDSPTKAPVQVPAPPNFMSPAISSS